MLETLSHGIHCIDTGYTRPGLACCYLLVDGGEAAIIETGTARSVPRVLAALAHAGVAREAVRYIIPTHAHLDHAGGAGALLQHCPDATLLAHPRAARHLIEPARLVAGATAVYGAERFARLYGEVVPAPAARVCVADDGSTWQLGSRRLRMRDTPGHARHHFCVWDEASRSWFSGDTFGIVYPELHLGSGPFVLPTTTPVQFEPDAFRDSVEALMAAEPTCFHLTHYGRISATAALAQALLEQIEEYVDLARGHADGDDAEARLREALTRATLARLRRAGCLWSEAALRRFLALDMDLNTAGLLHWWEGRAR
jgi:glyoxylase-like metal-dependent hydrolase (beta-lactamase superfamily II)